MNNDEVTRMIQLLEEKEEEIWMKNSLDWMKKILRTRKENKSNKN